MGPLYAHMYRDPPSGYMMRTKYPLVCEWIERTVGIEGPNRSYKNRSYSFKDNKMIPSIMVSDGGEWLPDDEIPSTVIPILRLFFDEMWPVLTSTMDVLGGYLKEVHTDHTLHLPSKSFGPEHPDQFPNGALTHVFNLRGRKGRRMVIPYQVWMLERLNLECPFNVNDASSLNDLLGEIGGSAAELMKLSQKLDKCHVSKVGGLIF